MTVHDPLAGLSPRERMVLELIGEGLTNRQIGERERCYRRQQQILDLEHYLDVLYRKPGALAGSTGRAEASGRSMAAELRPDLGSTDEASRQTERDQADD